MKTSRLFSSTLLGACSLFLLSTSQLAAATNFTGATDTSLTLVDNWDNGLPTLENEGIVNGFAVTTGGGDLNNLDGTILTLQGAASWSAAGMRWDDNVLTFNDTSSYLGSAAAALGRDLEDESSSTVNWNSSGSFDTSGANLLVGRRADGTFNQTAGSVLVGSVLIGGNSVPGEGGANDGVGLYTLSAGTLTADELIFQAAGGAFDFTADSTGVVTITNLALGGADVTTDLQGFIDAGNITIGGVAQTPGNYSAFTITYDIETGTTMQLSGEVAVTWAGYDVDENGWADTGAWMGWVFVDSPPWIYNLALDTWMFLPEDAVKTTGAWVYAAK